MFYVADSYVPYELIKKAKKITLLRLGDFLFAIRFGKNNIIVISFGIYLKESKAFVEVVVVSLSDIDYNAVSIKAGIQDVA